MTREGNGVRSKAIKEDVNVWGFVFRNDFLADKRPPVEC